MIKALTVALIVLFTIALSYAITVGIVYLICLCFSWKFNILIVSGIWLAMGLLRTVFSGGK